MSPQLATPHLVGRQLALGFPHRPGFSRATFVPADSNAAARHWLARTDEWPEHRLALWGEAGRGKTHLLRLWAERQGAALLGGPSLRDLPEPPTGPVALDDADLCPEESSLLHLLNAAREACTPVLLAGRAPPARWPVRLPDLASRLRALAAVEIGPPEEGLLRALFAHLLADRQLAVPAELQAWLLLRLPRSAGALREAAARLDHASLAAGKRVSRALAVAVLALETPCDEADAPASSCNPGFL